MAEEIKPSAPETTIGGFTLTNIRSTVILVMMLITFCATTYLAVKNGTPLPTAPPVVPLSVK